MATDANILLPIAAQTSPLEGSEPVKFKEADAIEIWIARWLRLPAKSLVARYGCDSRRLYEIWWGERFPGSRTKAEAEFRARYPGLVDRTSYGYRRIPQTVPRGRQMALFE